MPGNKHPQTAHLKATQFKPGQSGNPAGKPKAAILLQQALEGEWSTVSDRLKQLLFSDDEKVALEAAKFMCDHIKGKAKMTVGGEDGGAIVVDMGVVDMLRKLAT